MKENFAENFPMYFFMACVVVGLVGIVYNWIALQRETRTQQ